MKFNLTLDEALFDDDIPTFFSKDAESFDSSLDDDFSEYESQHDPENVLPGPANGPDTGVASEIIALINDEWEAIEGYNNAITSLRTLDHENPFYMDAIKVLQEIVSEENTHVGQLQEVLRRISPNAADIQKGTKEAVNQLGMSGGILPVQSWEEATPVTNTTNKINEMCTLSDIDDDM